MNQGWTTAGYRWGTWIVLIAVLLSAAGCNRAWYRRQADAEAYSLVREKGNHPQWEMDDFSIAVDPRSRMYYQYSPDCPPMPEDDPYSNELMQCVDGKRGYPFWGDNGQDPFRDNPVYQDYLQFDERGVLVISAADAVRLALLHSPQYQSNLEEMYLSALDVSFERFRFDVQGFSSHNFDFLTAAPLNTSAGNTRTRYGLDTFDSSLSKSFTTGSSLLLGLANSIVWEFNSAGPDTRVSTTLFDFTFIQPLLRNAGRDRVMERLTVAERALLANVRAMTYYRQGFYVQIMTGRAGVQGPNRRGGLFGGSGLEGFTGTGGGFGRVGGGGGGVGGGGVGGEAGGGQQGGYLGLLQAAQQIRNQEDNIERLRTNLFRLEQTLDELRTRSGEANLVSNILSQDLQVAQSRSTLFNSESLLLNDRAGYEQRLDQYKAILGLPPQLCLEVRDTLLDDFQLIDRETIDQQVELEGLIADFGEVRLRITQHIKTSNVPDPDDATRIRTVRVIEPYPELEQDLKDLKEKLVPIREVRRRLLEQHIPATRRDVQRLVQTIPRRTEHLANLKRKVDEASQESCPLLPAKEFSPEIFESSRLDSLGGELNKQLDELQQTAEVNYLRSLDGRDSRIDKLLAEGKTYNPEKLFIELYDGVLYPKTGPGAAADQPPDILVVLPGDILALQLVQARARTESIELAPVDLRAEEALEIARRYRLDWMNARATLVDTWRAIAFNADQLESQLDIFFSGDVTDVRRTQDGLPANLGFPRNGTLRAGVQFDAPITRMAERNNYRQVLIDYQQARRTYYTFEDTIARALRTEIRTVHTNQLNFELQRLQVLEAARQVDRNEDVRIETELSGRATGATAARDAIQALDTLLRAQNDFMSIWLNNESLRRSLDLDLGTLQLDRDGLWIDPGVINAAYGEIDPWLRHDNSFVMPQEPPREELPPPAPAPMPQGALPGARPFAFTSEATGSGQDADAGPATQSYGGLLPTRGQEASTYLPPLVGPPEPQSVAKPDSVQASPAAGAATENAAIPAAQPLATPQ